MYDGFFQPAECFKRIGVYAWFNEIYCIGNTVILFLSFVNCIIVGYILLIHMRLKGATNCKNYIKIKSLILILMLVYEVSVFNRYFWNFDLGKGALTTTYNLVLIASQTIQSMILFLICYFFTKKSAHFLEENSKIRKRLRIFMAIAIVAVIITSIG